jgi:hypothetical protein
MRCATLVVLLPAAGLLHPVLLKNKLSFSSLAVNCKVLPAASMYVTGLLFICLIWHLQARVQVL